VGLLGDLALLAIALQVIALLLLHLSRAPFALPKNNLKAVLKARAARPGALKPLAVCAGDSLTQALVSADWVGSLAHRHPSYEFANAGLNNELAWNILRRADELIEAGPSLLVLLVGTNDALASLSAPMGLRYMAEQVLPRLPDRAFFQTSLKALAEKLKGGLPWCRIILSSPPPIGEDPESPEWAHSASFASLSREVAEELGIQHADLFGAFAAAIEADRAKAIGSGAAPSKPPSFKRFRPVMRRALVDRLILGMGYEEIARRSGMRYFTDFVHFSEKGAEICESVIDAAIRAPWPRTQARARREPRRDGRR
jgi:lysophospholipase L1-like esterase